MLPTGRRTQDTVHRTRNTGYCPQDAKHRILPIGRKTQDATHRILPTGCQTQDTTHRILPTGRRTQDTVHRMPHTGYCPQDAKHRILPTGRETQDTAHRTQNTGRYPQDTAHRMPNTGRYPQDTAHRTPHTGYCPPDAAHRILSTGRETQDATHRILPTGCQTQDTTHRILPTGRHPQDTAHRILPIGRRLQNADHRILSTGRCQQDARETERHRTLDTGRCCAEFWLVDCTVWTYTPTECYVVGGAEVEVVLMSWLILLPVLWDQDCSALVAYRLSDLWGDSPLCPHRPSDRPSLTPAPGLVDLSARFHTRSSTAVRFMVLTGAPGQKDAPQERGGEEGARGRLEHPHTVPADGAVGVEVEGHQAFWTCDSKPSISVLTTVPPHTDSLGVSTKTKAGLVTEDDPLPF
ncbi:hypothetical protein NFI96_014521 [Prochilodus magdalenae]|nr:hypothetical protein NFI96_014521 [Prochilodus magdalenae]